MWQYNKDGLQPSSISYKLFKYIAVNIYEIWTNISIKTKIKLQYNSIKTHT